MITKNAASRTLIIHSIVRFDALQVEHHREQIRALFDEGFLNLIFDFDQTEYLNSSGLGLLVEFYNTAQRLGGSFRLLNLTPAVRTLLTETRLDTLLTASQTDEDTEVAAPEVPAFDPLHEIMSSEILLMTHLNETVERVLALEEPVEIGKAILEGLAPALRSSRGAVFFLTHQQERIQLVHWIDRNDPPLQPSFDARRLRFNTLESEVLNYSDLTVRRLPEHDAEASHALLHGLGFRNLLAAPIAGRLKQYGLICVETELDDAELQIARPLIRTLTRICGVALEKSALYKQLQEQMSEMNDTLGRLRRSRHALRDASGLAAMGTVITGLGHQLNNKLVPAVGYLQILQQQSDGLPPDVVHKLDAIRKSTDEISKIVQKMVRVSGLQVMHRVLMDPAEYLQVALTLFDHKIQQNGIEIRTDKLASPSGLVMGDPELFLQALIAILHRSIVSFDENGPPRVIDIASSRVNGSVELVIEDTGRPPEVTDTVEHLDPLMSFQQLEKGNIFNYTIPRSILMRHKGSLDIRTGDAGGKRISIHLPLAEQVQP
jgi:anti-anti-sigma factor